MDAMVHDGRTMKTLVLCLLAASATSMHGQQKADVGEEYLKKHPTEAFLPDKWVTDAQHLMTLAEVIQVNEGRVTGAREVVAAEAALKAKTDTVGEAVVLAALSHYADEVLTLGAINGKLELGKGLKPLLLDIAACKSELKKIIEIGATTARIAACEPMVGGSVADTSDANSEKASVTHPGPTMKRLFVVDSVTEVASTNVSTAGIFGTTATSTSGEAHTAGYAIAELMKRCPTAMVITNDRSTANYFLAPAMKASTLTNKAGDVLFVSPAIKANNMAKDVCRYLETH